MSACAARPALGGERAARLVYQDWRTDWFPPMAREMIAQFHDQHPGIEVFYTLDPPSPEFNTAMLRDFEAGTAPDVFQGNGMFFPIWAQKGYTLDLAPLLADLPAALKSGWDPAQVQALALRGGSQFALPKYHGALALYFNKDLFDRFHVDYPDSSWDIDDYLAAMRALTLDPDGDGRPEQWGSMCAISWDRIQCWVNAFGGHLVDPENPAVSRMGEAPALAAMEWLRARMWDDRVMASSLDISSRSMAAAFAGESLAMIEDGSWSLKEVLSKASFRVGVAPLPSGPARRVSFATTDGFGVYARTRYPQEALLLLQFLISDEYSRAMIRANLLQPARAALLPEWIDEVKRQYPAQAGSIDLQVFTHGHVEGSSIVTEVFANQEVAERLANEAWHQIFTLGRAPVETMTAASVRIEQEQRP